MWLYSVDIVAFQKCCCFLHAVVHVGHAASHEPRRAASAVPVAAGLARLESALRGLQLVFGCGRCVAPVVTELARLRSAIKDIQRLGLCCGLCCVKHPPCGYIFCFLLPASVWFLFETAARCP